MVPNERTVESLENELNEMETSNLSNIQFKAMVIRMFKELSENYNSMKQGIKTIKKKQSEMQNTISEIKNALKGMNSR